ncbi:alpha/beta hydrolase [Oricola cellulosilytica]|uniref:Alpha/beta hydrolase n=1 Tax=Oricola cellulosilytica TaxID=1429082 RepID=A0A4R0PG07_9HYPH|nr:alpha/beta hydrolase [Oricola cellulosilytica]TCD15873.1 alpha/beta hydrolase [Oricola cellulosilytica]
MWFFKLIFILAVAYIAVVAVMYAAQTQMLFPTRLATAGQPLLPASAGRLEVETPDGEHLQGVHVAPAQVLPEERLVVLGFGGNAWNAENLAAYLHGLYPDVEVVAFHYRGYRPSTGRPSAAALLADASVVYDHVVATLETERVVAVGFSIGAGVAIHLASRRPLAGLIVVSPFDSLEALAREHYPWAPVGWLLRHHMSTVEDVRGLTTPIALIAAGRDTVVPPRRTEAVRQAAPALVFDRTIAFADHNDLYGRPDFRMAMLEALARINLPTTH